MMAAVRASGEDARPAGSAGGRRRRSGRGSRAPAAARRATTWRRAGWRPAGVDLERQRRGHRRWRSERATHPAPRMRWRIHCQRGEHGQQDELDQGDVGQHVRPVGHLHPLLRAASGEQQRPPGRPDPRWSPAVAGPDVYPSTPAGSLAGSHRARPPPGGRRSGRSCRPRRSTAARTASGLPATTSERAGARWTVADEVRPVGEVLDQRPEHGHHGLALGHRGLAQVDVLVVAGPEGGQGLGRLLVHARPGRCAAWPTRRRR